MSNTDAGAGLAGAPGSVNLPCNERCPKCGSPDVLRQFVQSGESWANRSDRVRGNEFLVSDKFDVQCFRDCITHHCRICQWDWETPPLPSPNACVCDGGDKVSTGTPAQPPFAGRNGWALVG